MNFIRSQKIRWLNILIGVLLLGSFCLNIIFLHMINILDFSMQKPYSIPFAPGANPDFYLISYADGKEVFFQNRNLLVASAINRGVDFILNYRRDHIDADYIQQHPILQEKIGAGYWLWKPYLLLKTLQNVPDGSIVLYADSGLIIREPIREYLHQQFHDNKDIVSFYYISDNAATIASGSTFAALACQSDSCRQGHHVWAGLLAVRNSAQSREFIATWLKYCEQDGLLQGGNQKLANYPEFTNHQHDEAILSVLVNRESPMVNFVSMDNDFHRYFKVHRRKSSNQSLIAYMSNKNIELEFVLQDIWPVNKLRKMMQRYTTE